MVPWLFASMVRRDILPQRFVDCRFPEHFIEKVVQIKNSTRPKRNFTSVAP